MRSLLMRFLVVCLFLSAVPVTAADNVLLQQPDGSDKRQGGVGDRAKTSASLDSTLAGEAVADDVMKVELRGYPVPVTTATTTVLKSGPGWLRRCVILGGVAGAITVYDNTAGSGAVIVPTFTPPAGIYNLELDATFSVGAAVVTSAATIMTCVAR